MCVSQNYKQIQAFTLWTSQITRFRFNTTSLYYNDEPVYHAEYKLTTRTKYSKLNVSKTPLEK